MGPSLAALATGALTGLAVERRRRARRSPARGRRHLSRPLFARCYAVFARLAERGELGRRRRALVGQARGLVLEAGAGTGENFKHLPAGATGLVALEPDPTMVRLARARLADAGVPIRMVRGVMEDLPFADASFDTAVVTLALCSVDDPAAAVAELRRVVRPGGRLLLLEHVRSGDEVVAAWQDRLEHPWAWLNGGCHPNRATTATVEAGGFRIDALERYGAASLPHVQAAATRA